MVGMLSVWVRFAVGYDSSTVLMIGFQWVLCRLSIGLKSGDSIPNLTRNEPDMSPAGFTVSSASLSVVDSWPTHWIFFVFCRFRVDLAGVTGVLGNWLGTPFHGSLIDSNPGSIRLTNLYMATRRYFPRYILGGVIYGVLCYITRYSYVPHLLCDYS